MSAYFGWFDNPDGARCPPVRRTDVGLVGPWHIFVLQLLAGNGGGCSGGGGKKSVQLFGTANKIWLFILDIQHTY